MANDVPVVPVQCQDAVDIQGIDLWQVGAVDDRATGRSTGGESITVSLCRLHDPLHHAPVKRIGRAHGKRHAQAVAGLRGQPPGHGMAPIAELSSQLQNALPCCLPHQRAVTE